MGAPGDHALEIALLGRGPQLEGRLVAGADDAQHARILAGQLRDGNGRSGAGPDRCQVIAGDQRLQLSGIGVEQENRRLVPGQAPVGIAGPVAAGFDAQDEPRPVETGLEPVERIAMADRLAHDRKVPGRARRCGGEDRFDRLEGVLPADQPGADFVGKDRNPDLRCGAGGASGGIRPAGPRGRFRRHQ